MKLFILSFLAAAGLIIGAAASNASAFEACDYLWTKSGSICSTSGSSICVDTRCWTNPYWRPTYTVVVDPYTKAMTCSCKCCLPN
jgi:hypothetical protein